MNWTHISRGTRRYGTHSLLMNRGCSLRLAGVAHRAAYCLGIILQVIKTFPKLIVDLVSGISVLMQSPRSSVLTNTGTYSSGKMKIILNAAITTTSTTVRMVSSLRHQAKTNQQSFMTPESFPRMELKQCRIWMAVSLVLLVAPHLHEQMPTLYIPSPWRVRMQSQPINRETTKIRLMMQRRQERRMKRMRARL